MQAYFSDIWQSRFFWLSLVKMDLQTRYRRSMLGIGWSLLYPLCTATVICVVFHHLFKVSIRDFVPLLLAGLAFWGFITGVTLQGCQCFVQAEPYIRQHPLPLAVYPLRITLGALFHFMIALVLVLVFTWLVRGPQNPRALLALVPGLTILMVFGWAVAVLAGYVNVIFRDTHHLCEIGFQVLFYLTPIIYPSQMLADNQLAWVVRLNPLIPLLEMIRIPVIQGEFPPSACLMWATLVTLILALSATLVLRPAQKRVILYL